MKENKISQEKAMEFILAGKHLEELHVEELCLKNNSIEKDIYLTNCSIGKITFQKCVFKGKFVAHNTIFLNKVDFNVEPDDTVFENETFFENCKFEKEVNLKGVIFKEKTSFKNTTFAERISFADAVFESTSDFEDTKFNNTSRFETAIFKKQTNFQKSYFKGKSNFKNAKFLDNVFFRKVTFENGAKFENCVFGVARFEDMIAKSKITFKVASFGYRAYFHRSIFEDEVSFRGCNFKDYMYLSHMTCHSKVDLSAIEAFSPVTIEETNFKDEVDISKCIFHHDVYLRGTQFEKSVTFEQTICDLRLDCSQVNFRGNITFHSANPNVLVMERKQVEKKISSEIEKDYEKAKKVYVLLRRNFEFMGNHEDADWAYYKFRQLERKACKSKNVFDKIKKAANWLFFDLGSGYGTKPFNITILAAAVILIFSGIFWMYGEQFVIDSKLRECDSGISIMQAFYLSAMTFTTMGTEGISPKFDNWLKYFLVLEGLLGLFMVAVFVGTYTRKMAK